MEGGNSLFFPSTFFFPPKPTLTQKRRVDRITAWAKGEWAGVVGLACGTWLAWTVLGPRAEPWLCAQLSGGCVLYPATLGDTAAMLASVVAVQAVQALCCAVLVAGLTEPVDFFSTPDTTPRSTVRFGPLLEALAAPDRTLASTGLFALAHVAHDDAKRTALLAYTNRGACARVLDACERPVAAFAAYLAQYRDYFRTHTQPQPQPQPFPQQPQFQPPPFLQQQPQQPFPQQPQFQFQGQQPQQPLGAFQRRPAAPRWGAQPFVAFARRPTVRLSRENLRLVLRAGDLWCVPALVLPGALLWDRYLRAVLRELQMLRMPPPHYAPETLQQLLWALETVRVLVPAAVGEDTLAAVEHTAHIAQVLGALTRLDAALRAVLEEEQRQCMYGALRPCAPMHPQERAALAGLQRTLHDALTEVVGACNPTALNTMPLDESVRSLLPSYSTL